MLELGSVGEASPESQLVKNRGDGGVFRDWEDSQ
jgi:hypothetical protein